MAGGTENLCLSRRHVLAGGASLSLWGLLPRTASAAGTRDPRLLTIILRGALDGIALASPAGDPDLVRLRGALAIPATGEGAGLALDGFFALNPAMPHLHQLYQKREAMIAHAIATPYRERSHFDGQDVLESGLAGVGRADTGWLNRALAHLDKAGAAGARANPKGLAMGAVVPLVMRGDAPVLSWIPKTFGFPLQASTIHRLMDLYAHTDPALARAFAEGIEIDKVAGLAATPVAAPGGKPGPVAPPPPAPPQQQQFRPFVDTAQTAAKFLSSADGPRVGVLSYDGWDTHANEGAVKGQLANRLAGLDAALHTFAEGMGPAWKDTVVVVVTEFGRTARTNGTDGTDHGTATMALVLGGAVKGGRMLVDWPGLADQALHEKRDLKPTRDLRGLFKGVLHDHLGIPAPVLADAVFPGSATVKPYDGLLV